MPNINGYNSDIQNEQMQKLAELFPEAVREGKVDFDALKATLGEDIELGLLHRGCFGTERGDCFRDGIQQDYTADMP